jgi:hypothetical protein
LIKLLIEVRSRVNWNNRTGPYEILTGQMNSTHDLAPIVGSIENDTTPTSSNVHLYPDPETISTKSPILYADCEGLSAGKQVPISEHYLATHAAELPWILEGWNGFSPKLIAWANSEKTKKRDYIAERLYPRILYTFSDVVVFVLNNGK